MASQPGAAPASSGSSAVKIILIIVAVIAVLGILVLAGGLFAVRHYITHNIHNGPGGQMSIQTPEGKVNLNASNTYTAAELHGSLSRRAEHARRHEDGYARRINGDGLIPHYGLETAGHRFLQGQVRQRYLGHGHSRRRYRHIQQEQAGIHHGDDYHEHCPG